jgi:hypothetical protein
MNFSLVAGNKSTIAAVEFARKMLDAPVVYSPVLFELCSNPEALAVCKIKLAVRFLFNVL